MRHPTARMTPNRVTLRKVTAWTQDAAGGRQPTGYTTARTNVPCAVQPTDYETRPEHMREAGVEYLTVKFYDDPGLRTRDTVVFGTKTLTVTGPSDSSGGAGRSFRVFCEYRPPGDG